mgnify:CR=1 FL=1
MDWTRGMSLSFDYYLVDVSTWRDLQKIDTVTTCHITRDIDMATLGQSSFTIVDLDDGERWIRCYMVASQDGEQERICLGTFLVQTPRKTSDGRATFMKCTAYPPLRVLAEAKPNTGYALAAGSNCLEAATSICAGLVGYIVVKDTGVKKVSFNNKKIPQDYYITMSTLDKDEVGVLTPFIMTAYKASVQRDFELSFSSEGDPAELTLTLIKTNSVRAQQCA